MAFVMRAVVMFW